LKEKQNREAKNETLHLSMHLYSNQEDPEQEWNHQWKWTCSWNQELTAFILTKKDNWNRSIEVQLQWRWDLRLDGHNIHNQHLKVELQWDSLKTAWRM